MAKDDWITTKEEVVISGYHPKHDKAIDPDWQSQRAEVGPGVAGEPVKLN